MTTEELDALVSRLRGSIYGEMDTRHLRDEAADAIEALQGAIQSGMEHAEERLENMNVLIAERDSLRDQLERCKNNYSLASHQRSELIAENAALAKVKRLSAMLNDPRQWAQNEWTTRIAQELTAAIGEPKGPDPLDPVDSPQPPLV